MAGPQDGHSCVQRRNASGGQCQQQYRCHQQRSAGHPPSATVAVVFSVDAVTLSVRFVHQRLVEILVIVTDRPSSETAWKSERMNLAHCQSGIYVQPCSGSKSDSAETAVRGSRDTPADQLWSIATNGLKISFDTKNATSYVPPSTTNAPHGCACVGNPRGAWPWMAHFLALNSSAVETAAPSGDGDTPLTTSLQSGSSFFCCGDDVAGSVRWFTAKTMAVYPAATSGAETLSALRRRGAGNGVSTPICNPPVPPSDRH